MRITLLLLTLFSSTTALGAVTSKPIDYQDEEVQLQGSLYWDDASNEKRPGVLVVPEWWGLNDYAHKRARMLAELGYVAFAADMYGKGKVTRDPAQAKEWMLEVTVDPELWQLRANAAIEQLRKSPLADNGKLAAIGYCFGGGTVLQLAYGGGYGLKGVVSFHGSLPAAPEESKGKIKPQILAFHGQADPFVAPEIAAQFQKKLDEAGASWEMVSFGGVKHSFTNPKVGEYGLDALQYDARADQRSWDSMKHFLKGLFN